MTAPSKPDPLFLPFKVGDIHRIADVYGMMTFMASFEGALEDETDHLTSANNLLLFRMVDPREGGAAYAGVTPECHCSADGIRIHLVGRHYGKTADTIQAYNYSPRQEPKWRKLPTRS